MSQTLKSVVRQSFKNFEFLVLDDGSTDGSSDIIKQYANNDRRIIAFYEQNTGKCNATNLLVERAKDLYCAFLDADDVMLPERLEKQLAFHTANPKLDSSSCHCGYIDQDGISMGTQQYPNLRTVEESIKARRSAIFVHCAFTGLFLSTSVYASVGGLDSRYWPAEDFEFANRLIERGYILVIIQEFLMKYRIHSSSITAKDPMHMFDKMDYASYNIRLRRFGQPESAFDVFMARWANDPGWVKLNRKCLNYLQLYLREANFALN